MVTPTSTIVHLSAKELEYIPKYILIDFYSKDIPYIYHKLRRSLQDDSDVQDCLFCYKHHNPPYSRDHIDGPVPLKKDCRVCQRQ